MLDLKQTKNGIFRRSSKNVKELLADMQIFVQYDNLDMYGCDADSIIRISLKQDTLFGKGCDIPKPDKMCGMVIRIRKSPA